MKEKVEKEENSKEMLEYTVKNKIEGKDKQANNKTKKLIICVVIIVALILVILIVTNKEGNIKIKVKSSLDRIVEKSDLETVNFTYNVIGKQCKDKNKCNKNSNDIDDFEYVVSCKGTITAGIDFKNIKVEVDETNKKLIVKIPNAEIKETNVISSKFLNGEDISADELPNARKLCEETIKEKSENDGNLLPAAQEQAEVVLQSFYEQWVKSFDEEYKVEIK